MNYPEKTCTIDRLIRHPKLIEAAIAGRKTEQRRDGLYAYPGERFSLGNATFVVEDVFRQRLGEMTDEDARAEGFSNLEAYKAFVLSLHPGMRWRDEGLVWVHRFRKTS